MLTKVKEGNEKKREKRVKGNLWGLEMKIKGNN